MLVDIKTGTGVCLNVEAQKVKSGNNPPCHCAVGPVQCGLGGCCKNSLKHFSQIKVPILTFVSIDTEKQIKYIVGLQGMRIENGWKTVPYHCALLDRHYQYVMFMKITVVEKPHRFGTSTQII